MKKSFYQSSLKIIKNYILRNSNTLKKENNKKKLLNEKKRKSSKIRREKEREREREFQTACKQDQPSGSPRRVNRHGSSPRSSRWINIKLAVYRYHRSITDAAKLAREFWHEGWAGVEIYANDPSRWPGRLPLQRRGRGCNFEGNLTWTAAASVSYGQMFTVEIVYSLFPHFLSLGQRGGRKGRDRYPRDVRIFIFYSRWWYRTSSRSLTFIRRLICLLADGGYSNADISALWPRSCGRGAVSVIC